MAVKHLWEMSILLLLAISIFSRGAFKNLVDLLELRCCGLFRPSKMDWYNQFDIPGGESSTSKRMPLNVQRDNYQFV